MYHFIALSWKPGNASAELEALRARESLERSSAAWEVLVQSGGLTVYSRKPVDPAMRAYVLPCHGGVIFGRLFHSASTRRSVDASTLDPTRMITSGGRALLEDYWGSYVAILHSRDGGTTLVIRDCSGRLPCYYVNLAEIYVFFSDIRDIRPLGLRFTLNPPYLASYILHHPLHLRSTGLREVSELLAGDCVSITPRGMTHRFLWDPRAIAEAPIIDDYAQGKTELAFVTEHVIRCWASIYDRILLSLSGGLDSAIVLGCLQRIGQADRVVCFNQYTENTSDDERSYARSAAQMAGVRLIEFPRVHDARLFVEKLQIAPPDPKPDFTAAARMLALDATNEMAEDFHCDTVWTGQGGDQVFWHAHDAYPAADYLMHHRLPYRLPAILYDSAVLSRQSLWSVFAQALRYSLRIPATPQEPFDSCGATLMNQSILAEIPEIYHATPWHLGAGRLPPGKQAQVDTFADLLNRHKPLPVLESPYQCHPLISQPLLELSLRIPTYQLLRGGRQRAMARDAFADRVPISILRREDKGGVRDQARALLRGSVALLREALLDGILVSLGILDRTSIERIIVAQDTYRPAEVFPLFGCLAVEMWARQWTTRAAETTAA